MAKDVSNEDDDDKFEKMDDESLGFLEQVKKGKARNFVLSMKGNKVRSLLVKKKPIKDKDRKEARGGGFQPVFGVATGTGLNITFTVARSDGFDDKTAGTKTEKLKKFLKEQTGTAYKPSFELVDTPPAVPFDDDDLQDPLIARFTKLEATINQVRDKHPANIPQIQASVNNLRGLLQDDETRASAERPLGEFEKYLNDLLAGKSVVPPAPPPPDSSTSPREPESRTTADDPSTIFKTRLAALLPRIKEAAGTPNGNEAKLKASEAGALARKQDFAQANAMLDQVESLLDDAKSSESSSSTDPSAALAAKLAEALKKLKPLMESVIEANPNRKGELHATMAQVVGEIKNKQYDQAKQNVTDFATLLKSLAAQKSAASVSESADRSTEFAARREALEPRLLEAQKADREKSTKLGAVWDYADQQAQSSNFKNAFQALDRLAIAIDEILSALSKSDAERFGIEEGIVEKRKFLLTRFKQIPLEIKPHLNAVKAKIAEESADDNPEELASELETVLQSLYDDLQGEINDMINSGDSSRMAGLKHRVMEDEVIQHLLANPFTDGTPFQSAVLNALDEIEQKLAG